MVTDVAVALAMPLIAMLAVYLTLHEQAVAEAERSDELVPYVDGADPDPSGPGARDWCRCGHMFEWHPSCERDVCGCRRFMAAYAPVGQSSESDAA